MYCWQCQAKLRVRGGKCRRCGAEVEAPALAGRGPRRRRFRLRLVGPALVLVGLAVLGVVHLRPPNVRTVAVPDVVGLTPAQARVALTRAGLTPRLKLRPSPARTYWNRVLQQQPAAGVAAARGEGVTLLVLLQEGTLPRGYHDPPETPAAERQEAALLSSATAPPEAHRPAPYRFSGVPRVVGQYVPEATQHLREVGLQLRIGEKRLSRAPLETVLAQDPPAGGDAPGDDLVRVVVSAGAGVPMPAVVGRQVQGARRLLREAGLWARVTWRRSHEPAGEVIGAGVRPRTRVVAGRTITLVVSLGPGRPS